MGRGVGTKGYVGTKEDVGYGGRGVLEKRRGIGILSGH